FKKIKWNENYSEDAEFKNISSESFFLEEKNEDLTSILDLNLKKAEDEIISFFELPCKLDFNLPSTLFASRISHNFPPHRDSILNNEVSFNKVIVGTYTAEFNKNKFKGGNIRIWDYYEEFGKISDLFPNSFIEIEQIENRLILYDIAKLHQMIQITPLNKVNKDDYVFYFLRRLSFT
ncbi:MAG: hypothetical protein SFU25_11340, partial [Candidatus Caenarcaniphilales bacterium]|nr:hypothetical protein [Candidatus Caenarcaniphilales bacterium]